MGTDADTLVTEGRAALAAWDWGAAAEAFAAALEQDPSPAAMAGLGQARYWQGNYPAALGHLEAAFRALVGEDQPSVAAGIAVRLAMLHGLIYGNAAAVSGWMGQAQRLLASCQEGPSHGALTLFEACICDSPEDRAAFASAAIEVARRHGDRALEATARAYLGKSWVERGEVARGMGLIDESAAAVSAGLLADAWAEGEIYCVLFDACEMTADVQRAVSWMDAVDHYVDRTRELPIAGICRMHFGGVLTAAGRWQEAEDELATALDIYAHGYVGTRFEAELRLADLRARQGRLDEASELIGPHADRPGASMPAARVHLERGEFAQAAAALERHLRRRGRGVLSAEQLALLVDVELARGAVAVARELADELAGLADRSGLTGIAGQARRARGHVEAAAGDRRAAVDQLEQAVEAFQEADRQLDLAMARLELAELVVEHDPEAAALAARTALDVLDEIGAGSQADRAAALLRQLGDRSRSAPRSGSVLTRRETEVLGLVAAGLRNREIADRLVISLRTVEDHVGRILSKLGASNRTEAVAVAQREYLLPSP